MAVEFKVEPRHWLLIVALCIALYACYRLIEPYVGAIVLAFVLSVLCLPVHRRIESRLSNRPALAAILSCVLLVVVILVPVSFVFVAIVQQGVLFAKQSYSWFSSGGAQQLMLHPYAQEALTLVNEWSPDISISGQQLVERMTEFSAGFGKVLLDLSTSLLSNITGLLFSFVLMLFVLFFLLRDHDKIVDTLHLVVPLSRSQEDALMSELSKVARSAVMGSFLTAIAQGIAGGVAMALVGFPGLFWGTIMAFASFIPVVGTALIWLPASLYLLLTGDWGWALFMAIWGAVVVGSIDNFLRPILMKGSTDSNMSTLLVFLSLLGGLQLFGLIGLLYGPIIFALTLVLFKLYTIEFKQFLEKQDKS